MPQLWWNDTDFLEFFGAEPSVGALSVSFAYEIEREGLRLRFTLWQFDRVIELSLFRGASDAALIDFSAYVRGEARFVNDKRGRHLDFEDSVAAPSLFSYLQYGDPFDRKRFPSAATIRLAIDPDIRIALVDYVSRT